MIELPAKSDRGEAERSANGEGLGLPNDYDAIEAAVMETARGRWFLSEYATRHRASDTGAVLAAIAGLGQALGLAATPSLPAAASPGEAGRGPGPLPHPEAASAQSRRAEIAAIAAVEAAECPAIAAEIGDVASEMGAAGRSLRAIAAQITALAEGLAGAGGREVEVHALEAQATALATIAALQDQAGERLARSAVRASVPGQRLDAIAALGRPRPERTTETADLRAATSLVEGSPSRRAVALEPDMPPPDDTVAAHLGADEEVDEEAASQSPSPAAPPNPASAGPIVADREAESSSSPIPPFRPAALDEDDVVFFVAPVAAGTEPVPPVRAALAAAPEIRSRASASADPTVTMTRAEKIALFC